MPWTTEQKTFCVETYFETKSFKSVQARFRREFNFNNYPDKSQIYRWVNKFRTSGTVQKLSSKAGEVRSGPHLRARTAENVAAVRDSVGRSPKKSIRRRSQELGIARKSVRRILLKDLHLYAYRIQIKQKLTQADKDKRVVMCQWFCEKIDMDPDFLDDVWFSDEAHFLLSGHMNSKNNIFWGTAPPEDVLERPLHSVKCTAWVAISKHGIIGPFWFEDEQERSVTVNTHRYIEVLRKFWTTLGRRARLIRTEQWFQQDGATPHTSNQTLTWLRQRFQERLISRRCDSEWAPHSPDLNPPDFYLWGYLKDHVYENNPQTIMDLKAAITARIREIPGAECVRVVNNFARRIQECLRQHGGHLEHIFERR